MKTYKIKGNDFTVTLSALTYFTSEYFGELVHSFRAYDYSEICSFPCGSVEITEM